MQWRPADWPVTTYRKAHMDRTLVLFVKADWDVTGLIMLKWLEKERNARAVRRSGAVTYVYDCTQSEGLGRQEMRKLGRDGVPNVFVVYRPGATEPEFHRPMHGYSDEDLGGLLRQVLTGKP